MMNKLTLHPLNDQVVRVLSSQGECVGNLKLIGAAPATGVQIQVFNDNVAAGTKIPLGQSEATPQVATVAANTATLKFKANYVATAASVGAGSGNSFVRYTLSYK